MSSRYRASAATLRHWEGIYPNQSWHLSSHDREWGKDFDDPGNTHFVGNTIYMLLVVLWPLPTTRIELPRYFQKIWLYSLLYMTALNVNESQLIPNLPACPNNICICAWFWLPKNSGARNFYMTAFVCHVTGANMDASPIDYDYAIPHRRCLDPKLCK